MAGSIFMPRRAHGSPCIPPRGHDARHGIRQRLRVARWDAEARLPLDDGFLLAACIRHDDGARCRLRLDRRAAEGFRLDRGREHAVAEGRRPYRCNGR